MKRSAPTTAPCTDSSDDAIISSWQQWQVRFRKSKKDSLLEDHHIDPHVLGHMHLKPTTSATNPLGGDDDDVFAYLPMTRRNSSDNSGTAHSNGNDHLDDDSSSFYTTTAPASDADALPFPALRRDHSSGGGRLSLHNKRQKLSTFSGI